MRFVYGVTPVVEGRNYLVYVASQRLHAIAQYRTRSQFWHYPDEVCFGPGRVTTFWELDPTNGVAPDRVQSATETPIAPTTPTISPTPATPRQMPLPVQSPMLSRFSLLEVD